MCPRKGQVSPPPAVSSPLRDSETTAQPSQPSDQQVCLWLVHTHLLSLGQDKLARQLRKKSSLDLTLFERLGGLDVGQEVAGEGTEVSLEDLVRQYQHPLEDTDDKNKKRKRKDSSSSSSSSGSSNDESSSESDSEDESSTSKKAKTVVTPPAPTAPKNNKPCFKCNQPGHFAKDCANEATCYKCKKVGHLSKDCPRDKAGADDYEEYYEDYGAHPKKESGDGGGGGVASIVCHHCQQTGHTRRNCPQADEKKVKPGDYSNVTCFHCKETGHLSRDCEKDGGVPCYNCGEVGHLSRDCTVSKAMLCYNCKKPGHLSKDCKETNGETSKMQCYKCQEFGHMARSCPNPKRERERGGMGRPERRHDGKRRRRDNGGFEVVPRNFGSGANSMPLGAFEGE